jgi:predicted nucleic acid-binding protein
VGLIEAVGGRSTYLDSNILIYNLERDSGFVDEIRMFLQWAELQALVITTSELTLAEMLIGPLKKKNREAADKIRDYVRSRPPLFAVLPINRAILEQAAVLRAETSLKLPDAIHASTALANSCEVFLTNDGRIKSIPGLQVLQLSDVI